MSEDYFTYKTLRQLQQKEQQSSTPTQISKDFYIKLEEFVKTLESNFDENANVLKAKLYKQELSNTKKLAQSIYDLREKKIVSAALIAARGAQPDLSHYIEIELELYYKLLDALNNTRHCLSKQRSKKKNQHTPNISENSKSESLKKEEHRKASSTPSRIPTQSEPTRIFRVLQDMPEFVGTDAKTYILYKQDVLCLPESIVPLLCKRGIIEELNVTLLKAVNE